MEFTSGEWLKDAVMNSRFRILAESELVSLFDQVFADRFLEFGPLSVEDHWHPKELKQYLGILESNNLTTANIDQRELSYMSFDGYESIFEELIQKNVTKIESTPLASKDFDVNEIKFSFGVGLNKTISKSNNGSNSRTHGGRYSSDKEKHKAGLLAEQKVFNPSLISY